jgi:outer membrane protein assembly factor BamD (BamD/ComL family)
MLSRGDYQGALKENKKVLSLNNSSSPADQALFNIGLIYAHYGNPDKDYLESIHYFEKLIQKHPESPLVEQAKIWVNVLNIIEKVKQVDIEIDKKKRELTR